MSLRLVGYLAYRRCGELVRGEKIPEYARSNGGKKRWSEGHEGHEGYISPELYMLVVRE